MKAQLEQGISAAPLPKQAPLPSPQVLLARAWPLTIYQLPGAPEVIYSQRLPGEIHIRGVRPLPREQFTRFGASALSVRLCPKFGFAFRLAADVQETAGDERCQNYSCNTEPAEYGETAFDGL
jgi:hypothetical protein